MEKGTIVVVDDEANIADLVELYLDREGFRVVKAATGADGLDAFHHHRPRLVILDVGLPDLDGLEVTLGGGHGPGAQAAGAARVALGQKFLDDDLDLYLAVDLYSDQGAQLEVDAMKVLGALPSPELDGKTLLELPVVALETINQATIFGRAWDSMRLWMK